MFLPLRLQLALATTAVLVSCSPTTYENACQAPPTGWRNTLDHHGIVVELGITPNGELLSGEKQLDEASLRSSLAEWNRMNPVPHVVLVPSADAPCDSVREVRKIMEAAPICQGSYSHCGEGNWKEWTYNAPQR